MHSFGTDFTGTGTSQEVETVPGQRYVFVWATGATKPSGVLRPEEKFADFNSIFPFFKEAGDADPLEFDLTTTKAGRMLFMAGCDRFRFTVANAGGATSFDYSIARVPL